MAKKLLIHLSGFGEFAGVKFNPTEELVKGFPNYLTTHPLDSRIEIASMTVYETSAIGAVESFEQVLKKHKELAANYTADTKVFYLHLGVAATSETFLLEQVAWNEASFRCPDQRGWTPQDLPIIASNGTLTHCYKCQLPLDVLNEEMAAEGYPVKVSQDAGRFLCNYIYYHSLHTSNKNSTDSLFLHVPPFQFVPEQDQLKFVRSLIQKIGRIYLEGHIIVRSVGVRSSLRDRIRDLVFGLDLLQMLRRLQGMKEKYVKELFMAIDHGFSAYLTISSLTIG